MPIIVLDSTNNHRYRPYQNPCYTQELGYHKGIHVFSIVAQCVKLHNFSAFQLRPPKHAGVLSKITRHFPGYLVNNYDMPDLDQIGPMPTLSASLL